jgi:hypothetical protein
MGLNMFGSSAGATPPNPDPKQFTIIDVITHGQFVVAMVYYRECTNFEGKKILLIKAPIDSDPVFWIYRLKVLDPHFSDVGTDGSTMIARFRPTRRYWKVAVKLAKELSGEE